MAFEAPNDLYVINNETGEKFIKGTRRNDGTYRKPIVVKEGFIPDEEKTRYVVKQKQRQMNRISLQAHPNYQMKYDKIDESDEKTKKKKKKKKASKQTDDEAQKELEKSISKLSINPTNTESNTPTGTNEAPIPSANKLRNLRKKLKSINELEEKIAGGYTPTSEQLNKISLKDGLEEEIKLLEKETEGS